MPDTAISERPVQKDARVRTYWNLHKDVYSIIHAEGDNYGRVAGYKKRPFFLRDVDFRVQEATRQKIVKSGVRDICGYVVGQIEYLSAPIEDMYRSYPAVMFDPFTMDSFEVDGCSIEHAECILCATSGDKPRVYLINP